MNWETIGPVALMGLNIFATIRIFRSDLLAKQRVLQLLLVWLIPVVGAIVCLVINASDSSSRDKTRDPNFDPADAQWDVVPRHPGAEAKTDDDYCTS